MSNTDRHPECHMRTSLGNCDPIGGFCTSVNTTICEALHKVAEPVVRCSECKYVGHDATTFLVCDRKGMGLKPFHVYHDDYCSYGERREDGEA